MEALVAPQSWSYIVRTTRVASPVEREDALKAVDYNLFSFPSSLLVADFLSDAGCAAASDVQWAALMRGDEAYGRNSGYFALLDVVRDIVERGAELPGELARKIVVNEPNPTFVPSDAAPEEGGFANGGHFQLVRPNIFIVPQQRCAEFLLFNGVRKAIGSTPGKEIFVLSNGLFDTTTSHARSCGFIPVSFSDAKSTAVSVAESPRKNNFCGNIDLARLKEFVQQKGAEHVLFVVMTLTNALQACHPVSMRNLRETAEFAHFHGIPVVFDAARFAYNAWAIHSFEAEYQNVPFAKVIAEMFLYCDAFAVGSKSASNSGGLLAFRDKGLFHRKFSTPARDIGTVLKEMQILNFGNDSYGGLSGRDLMAMAIGLSELVDPTRIEHDVKNAMRFAQLLFNAGVPGVSVNGTAIHIDVNAFFGEKSPLEDYRGIGLCVELIRLYGIRIAEIGPLAFGCDATTPNNVRISLPHGAYNDEHIQYTVAAVAELYRQREHIPKMKIIFGANAVLRHFIAGLEPIYPAVGKLVD